jgi:hypothetical protein
MGAENAAGPIAGNQAIMQIEMTSGGIFDAASIIKRTDPPGSNGTIILTFESCNSKPLNTIYHQSTDRG